MTSELLGNLDEVESRLREAKAKLRKSGASHVRKAELRREIQDICKLWYTTIRGPVREKFATLAPAIDDYSKHVFKLQTLSKAPNRTPSYIAAIDGVIGTIRRNLLLPIQESYELPTKFADLSSDTASIREADVMAYVSEAVGCANAGFKRAAIVMAWCATISRMHNKVAAVGLASFAAASTKLQQGSGRYKRFNKAFQISTNAELQNVGDSDLIWVLEGMGLLDTQAGDRLQERLEWRNQAGHPGSAPIEDDHVRVFFADITKLVLANPVFDVLNL